LKEINYSVDNQYYIFNQIERRKHIQWWVVDNVCRLCCVPINGRRHFETILRIRCGISFSLVIDDKRNEEEEEEEEEKESKTTKEMKK